jgi:hypothetical protein
MPELIKPVANLPLQTEPGCVREIKGCVFNPPVYLIRGHRYLINLTKNPLFVFSVQGMVVPLDTLGLMGQGEKLCYWSEEHQRYFFFTMPGFYVAPDEGGKTHFVKDFKFVQVSHRSEAGHIAVIMEAILGDPPLDWKASDQFDYREYKIEQITKQRTDRLNLIKAKNLSEI